LRAEWQVRLREAMAIKAKREAIERGKASTERLSKKGTGSM
jgi:hypothetical protein